MTSRPIDPSAQSFLHHLSLPQKPERYLSLPPGYGVFELPTRQEQIFSPLPPPPIGPISPLESHDDSFHQLLLTSTTLPAPLLAMTEIWLRSASLLLGPICILLSLRGNRLASILASASCAILFTDTSFVYEYGRGFGGAMFLLANLSAIRCVHSKRPGGRLALAIHGMVLGIGLIAVSAFLRSDGGRVIESSGECLANTLLESRVVEVPLDQLADPGIDLPTIEPGFYRSSTPIIESIASHWPELSRTYSIDHGATRYLFNGDLRTGIPFILNKNEDQEYIRVYAMNPFDGEHLALDIAFPISGYDDSSFDEKKADSRPFVHDVEKPVYLVLHGLNGGSQEEYVKDFVSRRRSEGSTVVVFIARGMMDTTVKGWNVFHGARTGDVDIAARSVRRGLDELAKSQGRDHKQIFAGVGYSMGAIILSNYVARSGTHCAFDAAIAISGGLDMRQQLNFKRSMRLWQPILTIGLREDILLGKFARHYKHRLTKDQFLKMLRVTSISSLDVEAIVNYNSFDSLVHYYSEMSALGDTRPEFNLFNGAQDNTCDINAGKSWGRIANVSIPFVVLQALDDPLVGWRTIGSENVQALAESGFGNTMLLLTKSGGHVGWPLGKNPKKNGWKWMNNAARDFVLAVVAAMGEMRNERESWPRSRMIV